MGHCASKALRSPVPVEVGDRLPSESIDTRYTPELGIMVAPRNDEVGIRAISSRNVMRSIAQLKCIYTNAHSSGIKQEELEAMLWHKAIVQQENCVAVAIMEI